MSDPLTSNQSVRVGDVLYVAKRCRDKSTGQEFWARYFVAVLKLRGNHMIDVLKLVLEPRDWDWDTLDVRSSNHVVTHLDEDKWPQGVSAIYMKLLAKHLIEPRGD